MSNPPPIPDAQRARVWLESEGARYATDVYVYNLVKALAADCERLQQENTALRSEIMAGVDALIDANDQSPADLLEGIKLLELTCNAEHEQLTASQQEVTRLKAEQQDGAEWRQGWTRATLDLTALTAALTTLRDEVEKEDWVLFGDLARVKVQRWADTLTHLLTGETR